MQQSCPGGTFPNPQFGNEENEETDEEPKIVALLKVLLRCCYTATL